MRNIFNWELVAQFNQEYYKDVINLNDVGEEEKAIARKKEYKEEPTIYDYYYEVKKEKEVYLLPSQALKELPVIIKSTQKIAYKGKGYYKITETKSLKIKPEMTMNYKEKIDLETNVDHEEPDLLKLKAIIDDTAIHNRINIREISYPSWAKDSGIRSKSLIRGDIVSVNKPSIGKIKYLLNNNNKLIKFNEIQKIDEKEKYGMSVFYEEVGDFNPLFINPTRAKDGSLEKSDIKELSTITSYNFPDESKGESKKDLFDFIFAPKILSRIFPLLYKGGNHKVGAMKERFEDITSPITREEIDAIVKYLKADLYYGQEEYKYGLSNIPRNYKLANTRWDKNFNRILNRVELYTIFCDEPIKEFRKFENLLYDCHIRYLNYVNENVLDVEEIIIGD